MKGYNSTILAYGQTGSGKTYTMFGPDVVKDNQMGIIPRVCQDLFSRIKSQSESIETSITIQMLEIYKEQLNDLLS